MRCHLREGIYGTGDFHLLHQSSAVPADLRKGGKTKCVKTY